MFNMLEIRFVDIHGILRAMNTPIAAGDLSKALDDPVFSEGVNIDGSSVAGFTELSNSDLHLLPEKETLIELPYTYEPKLAVMCEIRQNNRIFEGDTRSQLKQIIEKHLRSRGWSLKIGPEPEFYLLKENDPVDKGEYADTFPNSIAEGVIKRFSQHLSKSTLKPKVHHHEVGPGQYEIEIGHDFLLRTADAIVTYKAIIRALAVKNGYTATFMPKPFYGEAGNGMHFHTSLWEGSTNLFGTDKNKEISTIAKQFMAGILEHAQAMTAIVAPTVNSYKRLVPGYEAPVYLAWGPLNRSALLRVPMFQKPKNARFEYRCPDPSSNPYLAFIAVITAGMDGIERELELQLPTNKNIFRLSSKERKDLGIKTLPGNLFEALSYLERDAILRDALGNHIYKQFMNIKKEEWLQYSTQVTDWDWKNFLNV
ncbi:MAG: glutamine synthetase family protein [Candidatus Hodarchaeota archaeon]